ncbi:hypothetical protein H0A61_00067 [Koleobacter methoxysyntrophicus]|jgi:TrpR-related protein YerC/YecD|uniref:Trp repressor protein n=1 Tax=Koleobacter methoxysyntrophicus TaxID=2751313 RepID=A0A8A0RH01_9FIRM|nr:YerC/YecD family TrpR-related protein [Koleobacter methoxysyntrophicus]QSQ07751.1 hypothetical protein H0A61_00067 [Koleobacter methoxysyntrophicus]
MDFNKKLRDDAVDNLFKGILLLENVEECYRFFEDICTVGELKALAQRFQVAKMLKEGSTYNDIVEKTGASTATISRVKRFLNYGADGYNIILDRLKKQEEHNN